MRIKWSARKPWSTFGLLFKWSGGVYQLIWQEVLVFIVLYTFLSMTYWFLLPNDGRVLFENICIHSRQFMSVMPVVFILGFFVSMVLNRWWNYFQLLPFPDNIALHLTAYIHGVEEKPLRIRRTVIRYVNLSLILCLRCISTAAKRRYPTEKSLVQEGLMTAEEYSIYMDNEGSANYHRYYIPLIWATDIVTKARVENGLIRQDPQANQIIIDIGSFKDTLNKLILYDWVNPPLIYTQVTTLSVYMYFLSCLLGYQSLNSSKTNDTKEANDIYFAIFAILKFSIYVGWMKVAESLLNPLGDDEADFDVNYLIERNLQISYVLVDNVHETYPIMVKDQYWDNQNPQLPYTMETLPDRPIGSAFAGSVLNLEMKHPILELPSSGRSSRHNSVREYIERKWSQSHSTTDNVMDSTAAATPERRRSSVKETTPKSSVKKRPFVIGSFHESIKLKKKRDPFSTASTSDLEKTFEKSLRSETKRSSISDDSL